ncbi:MAG: hypothetical protein KA797_01740 [Chitinophagales bacterium]|nr:hypothetical protein [Chitinophagales bacterium]
MKRVIIFTLLSVYLIDLQAQANYSDKGCFDSSLTFEDEWVAEEGPQNDCSATEDTKRKTAKEFSIWRVSGRMVRKMLTENTRAAEVNSKELVNRSVLLAEHRNEEKE